MVAYASGDAHVRVASLVGWNVLALAVVGVRAGRQEKGHYWRRLFFAFALYTFFNCLYFLVPGLTGTSLTFPSVADFGLFASYLLYGIVLVRIGLSGGPTARGTLDVLIVTAALSVPLWEFVVRAALLAGGPVVVTLTTLTYPVMLTVLFALVLRVVFLSGASVLSGLVLLGWVSGEFGADIYISVSTANGSFQAFSNWFLLLFGSYACLGALALGPELGASINAKSGPSHGYGRLTLLGGSLLVPLVSLAVIGTDRRPLYALCMAGSLVVAIMVRLSMVSVNLAEQRDLYAQMRLLSVDLERQTLHDGLTGLPNRVLLGARIDNALAQRLTGADRGVVMLLLDLDRFKTVNDTYGHENGDRLLVAVADCLRLVCRDGDTVARLGGDEFAVVLPDADLAEALRVVDRIVKALAVPIPVSEIMIVPSASIGIVVADGQDRTSLIRHADIAMYAAKAKGGGASAVFNSELHDEVVIRHQMEIDLRGASARGELALEYQPVLDLARHEMVAVEALVRWQHPVHGWLLPSAFIPLAEESGSISEIGDWVLRQACQQASLWDREHLDAPPLDVAVNLSPLQLIDDSVIGRIRATIAAVDIDPHRVILEVTESAFGAEPERMIAMLESLKVLGVQLAVDDFGTGYSSLSLLRRMPADIIKIDKSFVDDIAREPQGWALVAAIVKLATSLGRRTHAEGIERGEQLAHLRALGCELGQGYLFDPALSADVIGARMDASAQKRRTAGQLTSP